MASPIVMKVVHDPDKLRWDERLSPQKKKLKLSLKQKAVIMNYVSPDSPTYGNMVRSYEKVYPDHVSEDSLNRCTDAFVKKPHIQRAISHMFEEYGFGIEKRIATLSKIGSGEAEMIKEEVTKEGDIVEIRVRPTFSERMKAVEIANKVDGTYAKIEAAREIAVDEHKRLQAKLVQDLANGKI